MSRALVLSTWWLALWLLAASAPPAPSAETDDTGDAPAGGFIDPLSPNAACYICHQTFIFEQLSAVHNAEKVTCIECHGLSAAHANDEDIGATPPDIRYAREQIDAACRKCHEEHDVPATEVLARFIQRKLKPNATVVCTDCHGRHRIAAAAETSPIVGGAPAN